MAWSFWDVTVRYFQVEEAVVGGAQQREWPDLILLWVVSVSYLFTQPRATSGLGCCFFFSPEFLGVLLGPNTHRYGPVLGSGDTQTIKM